MLHLRRTKEQHLEMKNFFWSELKREIECQKPTGVVDFYIFSSISALLPGIAHLRVYLEVKNMMVYICAIE